jgi:hypothetical protein
VGKGGEGTQIIRQHSKLWYSIYYNQVAGEVDPTTDVTTENGSKTYHYDKMPSLLADMSIASFSILVFVGDSYYPVHV